MKVYIVRHGESEANAKGLYQHRDVKLSKLGIQQAHTVAKRFLDIPVEAIFSSSYERAKHTAEIIGNTIQKPVEFLPLLTEIKRPSIVEGKRFNDPSIKDVMVRIWSNWHDALWRHSDEETFFDIKERALKLLDYLEGLRNKKQILLVSHGTFIRMLICVMLYGKILTPNEFKKYLSFLKTTNTGITLCEYKHHKWRLITWNDQAHLG